MKRFVSLVMLLGLFTTAVWAQGPRKGMHSRMGVPFPETQNRGYRLTHQYLDYYQTGSETWFTNSSWDFHYPSTQYALFDSFYCHYFDEDGYYQEGVADCQYDGLGYMTSWHYETGWDDQYQIYTTTNYFDAGHRLTRSFCINSNQLVDMIFSDLNPVYAGASISSLYLTLYFFTNGVYYTRLVYLTDAQGRIATVTNSTSPDSLDWSYLEKSEITYHPSDDGTMADFIENLSRRYAADIDSYFADTYYMYYSGKPIQILYYMQGYPERPWTLSGRNLYYYDSFGDLDHIAFDYYYNEVWESYGLYEYIYDANRNLSSIEYWRENYNRQMEPVERYRFEWEIFTANDDQIATPSVFSAYPNPFKGALNLEFKSAKLAEVTIYNLRGQKVYSAQVSGADTVTWQAENLPCGVYLVSVRQNGVISTRKVVLLE